MRTERKSNIIIKKNTKAGKTNNFKIFLLDKIVKKNKVTKTPTTSPA